MKRGLGILFLLLVALPHGLLAKGRILNRTIQCGGHARDYILYLPDGYDPEKPAPLVLAFHGGGGNSKQALKHYRWNPLADRHGFVVCYPNAANKHWNDGRTGEVFREENSKLDDVGFVTERIIGKTSRDFAATETIWKFFAANGRGKKTKGTP